MTHPQQDNPKGNKMTDKIDIDDIVLQLKMIKTIAPKGNGKTSIDWDKLTSDTITALADMKAREDVLKYKLETISKCLVEGYYKTAVNYANGYLDSQGANPKGDEL